MREQRNKISFRGQKIYVGIDVHLKSWSVTVLSETSVLKKFSQHPSPEALYGFLTRSYPGAEYHSVYEAGFCGFWIHERLTALGIDNIVVNPADVPTKSSEKLRKTDTVDSGKLARSLNQRAERHLYAGQRIVGDAFLDKIEELDNQRHDPSEESAQVSTSVFRHRDSAGVSHSVFQLVEALFRLVEGDRDAHPERPSGPRHSYPASGRVTPSETGDDTGFTDIGQDGSIPRTAAVDYERSGVRAGYGNGVPLRDMRHNPLPQCRTTGCLYRNDPDVPLLRRERWDGGYYHTKTRRYAL